MPEKKPEAGARERKPRPAADKGAKPTAVIAGDTFAAAPRRDPELVRRILEDPRMHDHKDGFQSCIQCGVCTSGCPAARFTEYVPREIARRALDGDETLLTDDSVWYCYSCYTCQSRCPRHNSVAVINQVVRGMQVENGYGHKHVEMFAEWCGNFYEKGAGGNPHDMFPVVSEAWGEKWAEYMKHLLEIRAELGLGELFPPENVVKEIQVVFEETGFLERLRQVREGAGEPAESAGGGAEEPAKSESAE